MTRYRGAQRIRIGIAGVGNCASSLVQGLSYYADAEANTPPAGLMRVDVGGYRVEDIEVVCAFDVARGKVGADLADAIFAAPNNTARFAAVRRTGVTVARGRTLDGIGRYLRSEIEESQAHEVDVAETLSRTHTDVLVSYLPVGATRASHFYAEQALAAGCGLVNCMPVFIASEPRFAQRFLDQGLPIIGDDIKSQVGATIVHRALLDLFRHRGVALDRTYQLNVGGNADFLNMLERDRLIDKKRSKTQAVTSLFDEPPPASSVHVGPSDHVPWLKDRKIAFLRLEGTGFGGVPLSLDVKLEVWDSPNSAGVVIDAVRCAKLALDRGIGGALAGPSSYFMKSPPVPLPDDEARHALERFIAAEA